MEGEVSKEPWGRRSKGPHLAASLSKKAPVPMVCERGPFVLGRLHSKGPVETTTRDWAEGNGWLDRSQTLQQGRMVGTWHGSGLGFQAAYGGPVER